MTSAKERFEKGKQLAGKLGREGYHVNVEPSVAGLAQVIQNMQRGYFVIPEEVAFELRDLVDHKHGVYRLHNNVRDLRSLHADIYRTLPLTLNDRGVERAAHIVGFMVSVPGSRKPRYTFSTKDVIAAQRFADSFCDSAFVYYPATGEGDPVYLSNQGTRVHLLGVDDSYGRLTVNGRDFPSFTQPDGQSHHPEWRLETTREHEEFFDHSRFQGDKVGLKDHKGQREYTFVDWNGHLQKLKGTGGHFDERIPHLHAQDIATVLIADRYMHSVGKKVNHPFKQFRSAGLQFDSALAENGVIVGAGGALRVPLEHEHEILLNYTFGSLAKE